MFAKQMFDVIVFSSFAAFGWAALLQAFFSVKNKQY